jgi:hypothetical protein
MNITLIFCGGGNRRFAEIAIAAGFKYGARLPGTPYAPIYFADQNWRKPNRVAYISALEKYRPFIASVMDWERAEQLPEVLEWAEEAAKFVGGVMIIPKVQNGVSLLPRVIGGKSVRLGYSVPTSHGGTELMVSEFYGWPVHLLGGSPHAQVNIARYLPNVISVDGNMAMKMATQFAAFYCPEWKGGKHSRWPTILDYDGKLWGGGDAPYEAFRRSCVNIQSMWMKFLSPTPGVTV